MREIYFNVEPVERIQGNDIRVYGIEKGRKEQENYQEAARAAEVRRKAQLKKTAEEQNAVSKNGNSFERRSFLISDRERMQYAGHSLEERQQQIAFQKRAQESKARRNQMFVAYGKE